MSSVLDRNAWFALVAARLGHVEWERVLHILRDHPPATGGELVESLCRESQLGREARENIWHAVDTFLSSVGTSRGSDVVLASHEASLPLFDDPTVEANDESGDAARGHVQRTEPASCRYERQRPLARGGLGEVFVARDQELGREVALKEIQSKISKDPACRQRFTVEAEITGALEHPGVVPVYGYGMYPDGRPFYAMRLIRGDSMQKAIAELHAKRERTGPAENDWSLAMRKLLTRFVAVCHAVDFAHSRGILHRDIKPENIMLGPYGETLLVDWGLAKVIGRQDVAMASQASTATLRPPSGKDSQPTQMGAAVGTPAFMSPEQAMGWHDSLTPASDVYSLGATLYALLCGKPPFTEGSVVDILRDVQLGDFPAPRAVHRDVSPGLEAICLKAMDLKPSNRYRSAGDLAADVEAYLADAPIEAWREPWHVRIGRWMRRHRTLVGSSVAGASVLIVGLVVGMWLLLQANQRESALREQAVRERDRAQEFYKLARGSVDRFFTQVSEDRRMQLAGLQDFRTELLQTAKEFYDQLAEHAEDDASLAVDRAWAVFKLGSLHEEIGTTGDAIKQYGLARDEFSRLAELTPAEPELRMGEAMALTNLANLHHAHGETDQSERELGQAIGILERLVDKYPEQGEFQWRLIQSLDNRAVREMERGEWKRAIDNFERTMKLHEGLLEDNQRPVPMVDTLINAYVNLSIARKEQSDLLGGIEAAKSALQLAEELYSRDVAYAFYQHKLAAARKNLGSLLLAQEQFVEAEAAYVKTFEELQALVETQPQVAVFRSDLAQVAGELAILYGGTGRWSEAETHFSLARGIHERLQDHDEYSWDHRRHFATMLINHASVLLELGKFAEALQTLNRAEEIRTELAEKYPQAVEHQHSLATIAHLRAQILDDQGNVTEATQSIQAAIDRLHAVTERFGATPELRRALGTAHHQLADLFSKQEDHSSAQLEYEAARQIEVRLHEEYPDVPAFAITLGNTVHDLAVLAITQGRHDEEVLEDLTLAVDLAEGVLAVQPNHDDARRLAAVAHNERAYEFVHLQRFLEAARDFGRAGELGAGERALLARAYAALYLGFAGQISESVTGFEAIALEAEGAVDTPAAYYEAAGMACGLSSIVKVNYTQVQQTTNAEQTRNAVERLQQISLEILQQVVASGHFHEKEAQERFEADSRWMPVMNDPVFRELVEAIQSQKVDG